MGLIELFIRRRVMTTVLVLIAAIIGIQSYFDLGLRRFPDIEFPFATVTTVFPGGSPAEIETEITKRVEDAVSSISGIDEIQSFSQQGVSMVLIQFKLEEDIDVKAMDIRNQIDLIRRDLPDDAEDPVVTKFNITQSPVMTLALFGPQGSNQLFQLADEELSNRLSQVSGVANVEIAGGQRREIQVRLRARALRALKIPIGTVVAALQAANVDVPAGHITQTDREYIVRTTGRFESLDEIESVEIPTAGEGRVLVGDVADVVDTYGEARTLARFRGESNGEGEADGAQPAVVMVIQSESGSNEVDVADGVYAVLPEMRALLPEGARLDVAVDDTQFVRGALANVRSNMLIGICLTAVVLYLFLHSGRSTLIIALVMPSSVIITFTLMSFSDFTLNILTLTGLAITIGVLVNNAILIVDNVMDFIHQGEPPVEAAIKGTNDIAIAIFSSTATNLVVFVPLAFMGEIIGRFFLELGLTVAYATVVSLLVSYSLTPMMCGLLLKAEGTKPGPAARVADLLFGWFARAWQWAFDQVRDIYIHMLEWCLSRWWTRALTLSGTAVAFVCAIMAFVFGIVGMEFQPSSDEGWMRLTLQMPVGSSLEATDRALRAIEEEVSEIPELDKYYTRLGQVSGFLGGSSEGVNLAEMSIYIGDRAARTRSIEQVMNELRPRLADIPSAEIVVQSTEGGPGASPVEIEISGDDLDVLRGFTEKVMQVVAETPGTTGVSKSYQAGQPEVRIDPRIDDLNRFGVDVRTVATEVRSYVEGSTASQFRDGDENYDIEVKLREEDVAYAGDVEDLYVSSPTGEKLLIGQVADVQEEAGPSLITRKDRARLITVSSQVTGDRPLSPVIGDIKAKLAQMSLPEGVHINYGGEFELMQKNFAELFKAMATAAVLTFLATAGIIESFGLAAIIIMALPVCLIGVVVALILGDVTINMFALMAMVMLVGMVVNNAIIVIDYAARERHSGIPAGTAIRDACARRFRMIIMANLTTVVALIPLSLGLGFGGEIFRPLAVVQMGGILAAAVLSLLVIPVVYAVWRDVTKRLFPKTHAIEGATRYNHASEDAAPAARPESGEPAAESQDPAPGSENGGEEQRGSDS